VCSSDLKEGFRIIKVHRKVQPHRANLKEDYQFIKRMASQEITEKRMNEWVRKRIDRTYVKVNTEVYNCDFRNPWATPKTAMSDE
jgi:peptidyl-prolyl cis-trans isomerase SurA